MIFIIIRGLIASFFLSLAIHAQDGAVERIANYFSDLTQAKNSTLGDDKVDSSYRGKLLEVELRDYAISHFSSSEAEDLAIIWRRRNVPETLFVSMVPTGDFITTKILELNGIKDGRIISANDGLLHLKIKNEDGSIRDAYIVLNYLSHGHYEVSKVDLSQARNPKYRPFFRSVTLGIPKSQTRKSAWLTPYKACNNLIKGLTNGDENAGSNFVSVLMKHWSIDTEQPGYERKFGKRWSKEYRWIGCSSYYLLYFYPDIPPLLTFPEMLLKLEETGLEVLDTLQDSIYFGEEEGKFFYDINVNLPFLVEGKLITEKDAWLDLLKSDNKQISRRRIKFHIKILTVDGAASTLEEIAVK